MEKNGSKFMIFLLILFTSGKLDRAFGYQQKDKMKYFCNTSTSIPTIDDCARGAITIYREDTAPRYIEHYFERHIFFYTISAGLPPKHSFCQNADLLTFFNETVNEIAKYNPGKRLEDICNDDLNEYPEETYKTLHYAFFKKSIDVNQNPDFSDLFLEFISKNVEIDIYNKCMDTMEIYCNTKRPIRIFACAGGAIFNYKSDLQIDPNSIHGYLQNTILPSILSYGVTPPNLFCWNLERLYQSDGRIHIYKAAIEKILENLIQNKSKNIVLEDECIDELSDFPENTQNIIRHAFLFKIISSNGIQNFTDLYLDFISSKVYINEDIRAHGKKSPHEFCTNEQDSAP